MRAASSIRKDGNDLFVAGGNSHLVTADNLSHINDELSDELCCLATGDAWRTRKLYTNFDEASIDVCRPAMLNGISNPVRRSDHGERAILIETTKPQKSITASCATRSGSRPVTTASRTSLAGPRVPATSSRRPRSA